MNADRGNTLWVYALLIFISRLPFLSAGYGAEEDAWALRLVAERIARTGLYEVSRLPGHPVQELTYSLIWNSGDWIYNLLSAVISTAGIHAFMLLLRRQGIVSSGLAGLAMAFTPIVFIHSTDAMDYMWSISFILMSALATSHRRFLLAGLLFGIACGCRITSGAMLIPLSILSYAYADDEKRWMAVIRFAVCALSCAALVFLPVFANYGTGFFTFYEHFPIPGWIKNTYKGTIGVWGLPGIIAVVIAVFSAAFRTEQSTVQRGPMKHRQHLFGLACLIACLLYCIAFIRLPLKSAFMIPLIPFLLAWLAMRLSKARFRMLSFALILSCFTFGVNLADENRGSSVSSQAWVFEAGGQAVALDPIAGMVIADKSKRTQRVRYAEQVLSSMSGVKEQCVLITGWWQAHLLVLQHEEHYPPSPVLIRHYCNEEELTSWKKKGYTLYFLKDQAHYNDLRFGGEFTERLARPWPYLVEI